VKGRGPARIPVVEPNDPKAALRKQFAELIIPANHLRSHTHNQDHGRLRGITKRVIAKGEAVRFNEILRRTLDHTTDHQTFSSCSIGRLAGHRLRGRRFAIVRSELGLDPVKNIQLALDQISHSTHVHLVAFRVRFRSSRTRR
jgi:hypothetical protein